MEANQIVTAPKRSSTKAASTTLLFFGALLLFLLALYLLPTTAASGPGHAPLQAASILSPTTGSLIEIESKTYNVGQSRTVVITATVPPTASLDAFTIHVEYDPAIINYNNFCIVGSLFTGVCNESDGDGFPPDVVSFSAVSVTGVNGVVRLGELAFAGTGVGTTPLHLVVATWNDGNPDPPVTIDGQITINPAATSTLTPSPTATPGPSPTASMTPTPTSTSQATSTATPSSTPTPTLTSSPMPTPTGFATSTATPTTTITATPPVGDDYFVYLPVALND